MASSASSTAAVVIGAVVAVGGARAYQAWQEHSTPALPDSPVAIESPQERAASIEAAFKSADDVQDTEVETFIDRLQQAVNDGDTDAIGDMVAPGRMLDAVEATSGEALDPASRLVLEGELRNQMSEFFDPTVVEVDVKRIDRDAENNIVVYLRLVDRDRIIIKARWWLVSTDDGLRWWDGEDLQIGLRVSTAMSAGIAVAISQGNAASFERFVDVVGELAELDMEDTAAVRDFANRIDALDTDGLPRSFRELTVIARASAAMALLDPAGALERLDGIDADAEGPHHLPLRHFLRASASLALGDNADAIAAARRYLDVLGGDAEAFHVLGQAQLAEGNVDAARQAFLDGIADDPAQPSNYAGLATVSEDAAALDEPFAGVPTTAVLDEAAQGLADEGDDAALARLVAAGTKAQPSWDAARWQ